MFDLPRARSLQRTGSSSALTSLLPNAILPGVAPSVWRPLIVLGMSLLLSGCGSLGGGVGRDIGRATLRDIVLNVPEILNKHGYTVRQGTQTPKRVYYETSWLHRVPFEDESDTGAEEVRTRFIVEARKGASGYYNVRIRAENSVRGVSPDGGWTDLATNTFREHVRGVADDLMMEINAGVRVRPQE